MPQIPMPDGDDIEMRGDQVVLGVRRCPDGSAVFVMTRLDPAEIAGLALLVDAQTAMAVADFLINRPEGTPS